MKVVNDLVGYKNLNIVQDTDFFKFSLESVLLPNFVTINQKKLKILDVCTGNIPIPLILSTRISDESKIYAIELQKEIYDLAVETTEINNLESKITIINDDVKNLNRYFSAEYFDIITCNPPYFKVYDKSILNKSDIKTIARHEVKLDLKTLISLSAKYLKNNGIFAMVHRTERMTEVLILLHKYKLEPKRIKFIFPKRGTDSNLLMIECVKNGNPGLKKVEYIIIHDENGQYTEEVKKNFK